MATLPVDNQGQLLHTEELSNRKKKGSLLDRYLSYADSQDDQYIYWFMLAILAIPCVFMTLSILVMHKYGGGLEYYIGFAMILFFVNVIVHIAGMKARVYIPIFHITGLLMILIPAVAYLVSII